jgi:hypothetical protein
MIISLGPTGEHVAIVDLTSDASVFISALKIPGINAVRAPVEDGKLSIAVLTDDHWEITMTREDEPGAALVFTRKKLVGDFGNFVAHQYYSKQQSWKPMPKGDLAVPDDGLRLCVI